MVRVSNMHFHAVTKLTEEVEPRLVTFWPGPNEVPLELFDALGPLPDFLIVI